MLSNQLVNFRRETGQLVDEVNYLTKNDQWHKQQFYHAMEQSDHLIHQEGNRYRQQLEEKNVNGREHIKKNWINSKKQRHL